MPCAPDRRRRLPLGGALLALLAAACGGEPPSPGPARTALLITLDTTRADRLGAYGRADARTPVLDALAADGVRFDAAYSTAPITLPAHSSLLTGLVPPVHGVRDNGAYGLPDEAHTLAERLAEVGWHTGAFVGAYPVKGSFGLAQGFEVYDDRFGPRPAGGSYAERPAREVVDAALAWFGELPADAPAFAWVHVFDPHRPWPERADPYQRELRAVDRQLGRLFDGLDALDRGARQVVVVADHGEGLGEHGEDTHAQLVHDATLRVPLVMSGPGLPAGRVVEQPVSVVDVLPTLLSALDLDVRGELQGRDLSAAWRDGDLPPRPVYGESLYPELRHGWSRLHAWIDGEEKLVLAPRAERRVELYELSSDPGETRDLAPQRAARAARLADELQRWLGALPPPLVADAGQEQSDDTRAALAELGYLAADPVAEEAGRHPGDMIALIDLLDRGRAAAGAGRLGQARARLAEIVALEPEGLAALELGADIARVAGQGDRGELERAAELYARAAARAPARRGLWRALSEVEEQLGRPAAALAAPALDFAVSRPTAKLRARHEALLDALAPQAEVLETAGELEAALALWRALAERRPDDAAARAALARLGAGG